MREKIPTLLAFLGVLLLILWLSGYLGLRKHEPAEALANNRFESQAVTEFDSEINRIEKLRDAGKISWEEAARRKHEETVRMKHKQRITTEFPKNCPENQTGNGTPRLDMDLNYCEVGQWVIIPLPDEYNEQKYTVRLYAFGPGGTLSELKDTAKLAVVRKDGFSIAKQLNETDWLLRGLVKIQNEGNADHVRIVMQ